MLGVDAPACSSFLCQKIRITPMNQNLPIFDQNPKSSIKSSDPGRIRGWENEHIVQFYEKDTHLIDSLAEYVRTGLAAGEACLIVATEVHRDSLENRLLSEGFDLEGHRVSG